MDPLDGTSNFLQGLPIWGISVACQRGDEVIAGAIYDPLGGNLFDGFPRSGSTSGTGTP